MIVRTETESGARETFLLDRQKKRRQRFAALRPVVVSSVARVRESIGRASRDSLWISYETTLTDALLRNLPRPSAPIGSVLLLHPTKPETLPTLATSFKRIAFSPDGDFLPPEELAEALQAENRADLFVGGSIDRTSQTITLWRGNLEPLTVPFASFAESGDGTKPDFQKFSVTDYGQTVRLGEYEAAADAILYEFDPEYRRRISKERRQSEQSFGASLRRLRKQRGLRREDFAPAVAAKTIARIEQGKVQRIHPRTLNVIAKRLAVKPEEIETY